MGLPLLLLGLLLWLLLLHALPYLQLGGLEHQRLHLLERRAVSHRAHRTLRERVGHTAQSLRARVRARVQRAQTGRRVAHGGERAARVGQVGAERQLHVATECAETMRGENARRNKSNQCEDNGLDSEVD